MKTAEEIYYTLCQEKIMNWDRKNVVIEAMESYATEREAKYKELWGAYKELDIITKRRFEILADKSNSNVIEFIGLNRLMTELRQKITALEQELGLNKE